MNPGLGRIAIVALLVSVGVALDATGQAPHDRWRTIETTHYRVHFPDSHEDWARYAASRLESIREIVGTEVGYLPQAIVDVVVMDPVARANGSAWPFIGYPRMVLWTSPPGPESVIGNYSDWIELLTIHEQTHLAHLLRPSRNPLQRILGETVGLGPIPFRAPRWASEGYATVLEGDLTGSGRPQSDIRAAILRKWAQEGRLPSYAQMSSDERSYLGMSMAYLAGSAFLEWLREREGEGSFRDVWARVTARRTRSFEEAFRGVYGESPAKLYARFRAELTHASLELERQLETREGLLWQDLSWQTGAPAVSPDGERIAVVLRDREKPARLVIWKTGEDEKALEEWNEAVRKLIERDPLDVPAVRRKPLDRKPEQELVARDGADMSTPRWLADGSILFVRFEPDSDGFLHPDLFRWEPGSGRAERLTFQADLREPTPISPTEVIAVRRRFGKSSLVRYDLATGRIDDVTEPSLTRIVGWPRADSAGKRLAFARHERGRWHLTVLDLVTGTSRDLPLPPETTTVAYPEWHPDGNTLYATLGSGGLIDVWQFDLEGELPLPVTRSFGAALAPSLGGDGSRLFFLGLDADGLDLRVLEPPPPVALEPLTPEAAALVPLARPQWTTLPPPTAIPPEPSHAYGLGPLDTRWLFGGGRTPSQETWELGLRLGDLIGRFDSIVIGSVSDGGPEGGSARAIWRGWPVSVVGHLFAFDRQRRDASSPAEPGLPSTEDRRGGELLLEWDRVARDARLELEAGMLVDRTTATDLPIERDRTAMFVTLEGMLRSRLDPWVLAGSSSLSWIAGDQEKDSWKGWTGEIGLSGGLEDHTLAAWYRRGELDQIESGGLSFVVGGSPTSLTPAFDHLIQVWSPGLVEGAAVGSHYEGWRAELESEILFLVPFYEAHRAGASLDVDWIELTGARIDVDLEPFPLMKLPGATLSLGAAYMLEGPRHDEIEWWITTRWRIGDR